MTGTAVVDLMGTQRARFMHLSSRSFTPLTRGRGWHRISAAFALYTIRLVLMIFGPPVVVWLIIESHSAPHPHHTDKTPHTTSTRKCKVYKPQRKRTYSLGPPECASGTALPEQTQLQGGPSAPLRSVHREGGCSRVRETTVLVCESVHHAVLWQRNMISSQASSISAVALNGSVFHHCSSPPSCSRWTATSEMVGSGTSRNNNL